ncbi:MAG TPA: hypothetical protein VFD36_04005 [Kofleriaceae bacterium]|nr:hypothetical protein [Kofleriaceae bacterium]
MPFAAALDDEPIVARREIGVLRDALALAPASFQAWSKPWVNALVSIADRCVAVCYGQPR